MAVLYIFDSMDAVVLEGEEDIHSYDYIRHSHYANSPKVGTLPAAKSLVMIASLLVLQGSTADCLHSSGREAT